MLRKYIGALCAVVVLLVVGSAEADPITLEEGVAQSILDMTTRHPATGRRTLNWMPCGDRLSDEEKLSYARELAHQIVTEAGTDLDPWWMAAQLMQESGFNPCAMASEGARAYREAHGRGRSLTREDVHLIATSRRTREAYGITVVDMGIAQFRWPGGMARSLGVRDPETLLDSEVAIRYFAQALRHYHTACEEVTTYSGIYTTDSGRVLHYRVPCAEGYWVHHNTPRPTWNYVYYSNVRHRYEAGPALWRPRYEAGEDVVIEDLGG